MPTAAGFRPSGVSNHGPIAHALTSLSAQPWPRPVNRTIDLRKRLSTSGTMAEISGAREDFHFHEIHAGLECRKAMGGTGARRSLHGRG